MKYVFTKSVAIFATTTLMMPIVFAVNENIDMQSVDSHDSKKEMIYMEKLREQTSQNAFDAWLKMHCKIMQEGFVWGDSISMLVNEQTCNNIGGNISRNVFIQPSKMGSIVQLGIENSINKLMELSLFSYQNRFDYKEVIIEKMKKFENIKVQDVSTIDEYMEAMRKVHKEFENSDMLTMQSRNVFGSALYAGLLSLHKDFSSEKIQQLSEQEKFFFVTELLEKTKELSDSDVAFIRFGNKDELYASSDFILPKKSEKTKKIMPFQLNNKKNEKLSEDDFTIVLKNSPEWVKIDGNSLIIEDYPENVSDRYAFFIEVKPKNNEKVMIQEITVTFLDDQNFPGIQSFWNYYRNIQK